MKRLPILAQGFRQKTAGLVPPSKNHPLSDPATRTALIAVAVLVAIGTAGWNHVFHSPLMEAAARRQSVREFTRQGYDRLGEHNYRDAEAAYRQAVALAPDNAVAHYGLGYALCGQKRYQEGEASCRKALALRPNFANAYSGLGFALLAQGRFTEAETAVRKAIMLEPRNGKTHANLAGILLKLHRRDEALWEGKQARQLGYTAPHAALTELHL